MKANRRTGGALGATKKTAVSLRHTKRTASALTTGKSCSKNRHFGDDVLIVTQHTKQIEVACQRVAQDFWVVTNHSKLSIGMFRQPDVFSVAVYDQPPTGSMVQPMERKVFKLDKAGLGGCYDTAGGLRSGGSVGSAGDLFARKRGLPWWMIIVLVVVLGFGALKFTKILGWLVGRQISKQPALHQKAGSEAKPVAAANGTGQAVGIPSDVKTFRPDNSVTNGVASETNQAAAVRLFCSGWSQVPGDVLVFTSDGETYSVKEHEVDFIGRHSVRINGHLLPIIKTKAFSDYVPDKIEPYTKPEYYQNYNFGSTVTVIPFGQRREQNYLRTPSRNLIQQKMIRTLGDNSSDAPADYSP